MINKLLMMCLMVLLQVCVMAQSGVSEIPFEGGGVASVELPDGCIIYRDHDQKFLYRVYINESGSVSAATFHYGKEFNQSNVDIINKMLMKWRFHPHIVNGKSADAGFYLTISLMKSPVDGRPRMMVFQDTLTIIDAFLPMAKMQDLTDESKNKLIHEYQEHKELKSGIKGLFPEEK